MQLSSNQKEQLFTEVKTIVTVNIHCHQYRIPRHEIGSIHELEMVKERAIFEYQNNPEFHCLVESISHSVMRVFENTMDPDAANLRNRREFETS